MKLGINSIFKLINTIRERPHGRSFYFIKIWGCGMEVFIGMSCTVCGLLIGVLTFGRSRDKDVRAEATRTAIIETKLDNISLGVTSIQVDFKANETKMDELTEKVIRVEESAKQAHKRIDEFTKPKLEVS